MVDERLAAVIVTFHRGEGLRRSIEALVAQQRRPQTIIVVDNGGTVTDADLDGERLRRLGIDLELINPGHNTGPAGGFGLGMSAALASAHRWIYLLNDDDRPRPEAIRLLLQHVGRRTMLSMGWVSLSGKTIPTGAIWQRGLATPEWLVTAIKPYEVDVITFGGLLVPAEVVAAIGVPRSDYFMMWEEYEFCLRARQAGFHISVVPTPLVDIDGLPPGSRSAPWRAYYEARNSWETIRAHGTIGHRLWWARRQLKYSAAATLAPDRWTRLRHRGAGVIDGWRGTTGCTVLP